MDQIMSEASQNDDDLGLDDLAEAFQEADGLDETDNADDDNLESRSEDELETEGDEDGADEAEDAPEKASVTTKFLLPKKDEEGNPVVDDDGKPVMEEYDQAAIAEALEVQRNYASEKEQIVQYVEEAQQYVQKEVSDARQMAQQSIMQIGAAVQRIAGIMPAAELAQLAQTDPAAYVQRKAWNDHVAGVMQQVQNEYAAWQEQDTTARTNAAKQAEEAGLKQAWSDLTKAGINRKAVESIFGNVTKFYGVAKERLAKVSDATSVMIMKDAIAFRQLKESKPEVRNKVVTTTRQVSGKAPSDKGTAIRSKLLEKAVKSRGNASLDDLATFMRNN